MIFDSGIIKVYTLNSAKQLILLFEKTDTSILLDKPILMGDYNGDGKSDFLIPKGYGKTYELFTSTGNSYIKEDKTYDFAYNQNDEYNTYHLIPNDLNNDGKTDIIFVITGRIETQGLGSISTRLFSNKGTQFVSNMFADSSPRGTILAYPLPLFLSSNRPNRSLEMAFISGSNIQYFQSEKDFNKEKLLYTIKTGNGVTETVTYASLVPDNQNTNAVYKDRGGVEIYPNFDITVVPTFKIVSKLEKQSSNTYKKQLYSYYGAVTNMEGLGFLGFQGTMRTNWHDNTFPVISTVSKYDFTRRGVVTENYTVQGLGSPANNFLPTTFISKSLMTYVHTLSTKKVFNIKKTIVENYNGIDNISNTATTTYDIYNNPTSIISQVKNAGAVEQTTTSSVTYDNQNTNSNYYIARPLTKSTSISHNGYTNTSDEIYGYQNGLLTQIKKRNNSTNYITEDNQFDTFGNITQKTITAIGLTPRVSNYMYDTSGRFLIKSTDIEGLSTTYDYDTNSGLLKSDTDPYALTTTYTYGHL